MSRDINVILKDIQPQVIESLQKKAGEEIANRLSWKLTDEVDNFVAEYVREHVIPEVEIELREMTPELIAHVIGAVKTACETLEEQLAKKAIENLTKTYGPLDKVSDLIFGKGY